MNAPGSPCTAVPSRAAEFIDLAAASHGERMRLPSSKVRPRGVCDRPHTGPCMAERLVVTHLIYFSPPGRLRTRPRLTAIERPSMAATRKSAKRPSSKKQPARKSTSKRRGKKSAAPKGAGLKRRARKGLKAARGGLKSVIQAGGKTWKTLKSTTANVMEAWSKE
jgi:hypothetical protein